MSITNEPEAVTIFGGINQLSIIGKPEVIVITALQTNTDLVPSLSAAVVTSVYSFVDMIAIGRGVGADGAAALSIATPVFGVISLFGLLCGVGNGHYGIGSGIFCGYVPERSR